MSIARLSRERKRQLGQFFTPTATARAVVNDLVLLPAYRILEPSFGEGAFVFALLEALAPSVPRRRIPEWCVGHLYGCELDGAAYARFRQKWKAADLGPVPANMEHCDFFTWMPPGVDRSLAVDRQRYFRSRLEYFDLIVGNPPFGGSIEPRMQDPLDAILGMREGHKIKKETYAFFIVKSVDILKPGGRLVFICSDTILTIPTMTGLRSWLQNNCVIEVSDVPGSFPDTSQDMLLLTVTKQAPSRRRVTIFGTDVSLDKIEQTPNSSWRVDSEFAKYFSGVTLGDKMIATSGMTIGKNELFLRRIRHGAIEEPYDFSFARQPITLENEIARARLRKLSQRRRKEIAELEAGGATERVVRWRQLREPRRVTLPNADYCYYNKATSKILYSEPEWVIFWRDDGEYVYTFKKTGNWYLRGVGGMKYFGREGLTWSLIAPRLYARYLPPGHILDSGAPCAFLRNGVEEDELFFILGWALTDLANRILKEVLNHTRNNQSKDFERLPYPVWVGSERKRQAINAVKALVTAARAGKGVSFKSEEVRELNALYEWQDGVAQPTPMKKPGTRQLALF